MDSCLPPPLLFSFLLAVRAVNKKPEAAKSEVMFTFPPPRRQIRIFKPTGGYVHAKYETEQRQVPSGHQKTSYLFLLFPLCVPVAVNERKGEQASCPSDVKVILPSHSMKIICYSLNVQETSFALTKCHRKHTSLGRAAVKRTQKCRDCGKPTFCLGSQRKSTVSVWSKANLIKQIDYILALKQTNLRERSLRVYLYCYYAKKCVDISLNTTQSPVCHGCFECRRGQK